MFNDHVDEEFEAGSTGAGTLENDAAETASVEAAADDEPPKLPATTADSDDPHDFQLVSVYTPTTCDACSNLLLGLWNQGFRCQNEDCGQVVCHDCLESVPERCPFVRDD